MANHTDQKQHGQIDTCLHLNAIRQRIQAEIHPGEIAKCSLDFLVHHSERNKQDGHSRQRRPPAAGIPLLTVETNDECQQVETQWHNPEKRDHRDILTEVVSHRQEHNRPQGRQHQPRQTCPPGGNWGYFRN